MIAKQQISEYIDSVFDSNMQKHNEWLSNRGYVQHLQVLRRIKQRSKQNNQQSHSPKSTNFSKLSIQAPQRQQKILWDNFLLGKRIVQTPPVISKRRLERDYKNHQKLVQYRTASNSKRTLTTAYRLQKLREYQEDAELMDDDQRLKVTATARHLLFLQIIDLYFHRQRPAVNEISIVLTCLKADGKARKISSQCIPVQNLFSHRFYFKLTKKYHNLENPLTIELKTIKGLQELSLGCFSFVPTVSPDVQSAKLYHCGKLVGQVTVVAIRGGRQFVEPEKDSLIQRLTTPQMGRGTEGLAIGHQSFILNESRQPFSPQ